MDGEFRQHWDISPGKNSPSAAHACIQLPLIIRICKGWGREGAEETASRSFHTSLKASRLSPLPFLPFQTLVSPSYQVVHTRDIDETQRAILSSHWYLAFRVSCLTGYMLSYPPQPRWSSLAATIALSPHVTLLSIHIPASSINYTNKQQKPRHSIRGWGNIIGRALAQNAIWDSRPWAWRGITMDVPVETACILYEKPILASLSQTSIHTT